MIIKHVVAPAADFRPDEVLADVKVQWNYGVIGQHDALRLFEVQPATIRVDLGCGTLHQ